MTIALQEHQVNRLLRAFHADDTLSSMAKGGKPVMNFSVNGTPTGGILVSFKTMDAWHKLEVSNDNGTITHTTRAGTSETITKLTSDPDQSALKVTKQVRNFDFEQGQLGEPQDTPVQNPLLAANDILHMAHVASRIAETVQNQTQAASRG